MKITQIAKDMNIKSKEVTDFLKSIALDKKAGDQLDADEWSLFLDRLTKANQIENIDDYLDGKATLRVDRPAPVKKESAPPKAEEKKQESAPKAATPEKKDAPAKEEKKPQKSEVKPAPKVEEKIE